MADIVAFWVCPSYLQEEGGRGRSKLQMGREWWGGRIIGSHIDNPIDAEKGPTWPVEYFLTKASFYPRTFHIGNCSDGISCLLLTSIPVIAAIWTKHPSTSCPASSPTPKGKKIKKRASLMLESKLNIWHCIKVAKGSSALRQAFNLGKPGVSNITKNTNIICGAVMHATFLSIVMTMHIRNTAVENVGKMFSLCMKHETRKKTCFSNIELRNKALKMHEHICVSIWIITCEIISCWFRVLIYVR